MHAFLTLTGALPHAPTATPATPGAAAPAQPGAPAGAPSFAAVFAGVLAHAAGASPVVAALAAVAAGDAGAAPPTMDPLAAELPTIDVTLDEAATPEAMAAAEPVEGEVKDAAATAGTPVVPAPATPVPTHAAAVESARAAGALRTDSLDAVDPALRSKVERVIRRMKDEYGHDVQVAETWRDQRRQDALYAQGRTEPGDVVTWTRRSRHTMGLAADLVVDGTYDDPQAYARLQRVAREEGLRTLGMRDPGHVELPAALATGGVTVESIAIGDPVAAPAYAAARPSVARATQALRDAMPALPDETMPAPPAAAGAPARVAAPAPVARVAQVAGVAQVAQVARVASPGARGAAPRADAPVDAATATVTAPAMRVAAREGNQAARRAGAEGDAGRRQADSSSTERDAERATVGTPASSGAPRQASEPRGTAAPSPAPAMAGTSGAAPATTSAPVAAPVHVNAAARVADIQALRDRAVPRELSTLTLQVENAAGGTDRIRVDVRGQHVGADLAVASAADADRLTRGVEELRSALERHGLTTDVVRVAAPQAVQELSDPSRAAAGSNAARAAGIAGASLAADAGSLRQDQQQHQQQQDGRGQPQGERRQPQSHDDPRRGTAPRGRGTTGTTEGGNDA